MFLTPTQVSAVQNLVHTNIAATAANTVIALKAFTVATSTSGILASLLQEAIESAGAATVVGANSGTARTDMGDSLLTFCQNVEKGIHDTTTIGS